jgi:hypothetical protein
VAYPYLLPQYFLQIDLFHRYLPPPHVTPNGIFQIRGAPSRPAICPLRSIPAGRQDATQLFQLQPPLLRPGRGHPRRLSYYLLLAEIERHGVAVVDMHHQLHGRGVRGYIEDQKQMRCRSWDSIHILGIAPL